MNPHHGVVAPMGAPTPVTLAGSVVQLEPLAMDHIPELVAAGSDPAVWEWTITHGDTPEKMERYVRAALAEQQAGQALPFAVRHRADERVIGSSRYANIMLRDRCLEIGWTWYAPAYWRTAVNTECKLLLLTHAFEKLGAFRVEFKTDARNARSRTAIARLGASEEGTLRSKVILRDGRRRDTVYFSILDHEWPEVKARLTGWLAR